MEDSYTVHRRRKAAARRREKTPEPPKRRQDDVPETDDDEDARAKMERMVQETEMLEAFEEKERRRLESEKSSENIEKLTLQEDKPQRSLKRAMSPEIKRQDDENREEVETKTGGSVETNKAPGIVTVAPEVERESKGRPEETASELQKENEDTTEVSRNVSRHRRDVEKDSSSTPLEKKSSISEKKVSPQDPEKKESHPSDIDTNRSDERSRKVSGLSSPKKKSSKVVGEVEQAVMYDENRYEAVAREVDDEHVRTVSGKSLKNESTARRDLTKNEKNEEIKSSRSRETSARSSRLSDEKVEKRDVVSPARSRISEIRGSTITTSKRTSRERNDEKTGYETDSSEIEEAAKRSLRRKKSPEGAKLRSTSGKKVPSRSRPTTDTDGDPEEQEHRKKSDKKQSSRRRPSSETDEDTNSKKSPRGPSHREKRESSRVSSRQTDKPRIDEKRWSTYSTEVNDEESEQMKKSETFPPERVARDKSLSTTRSTTEIKKQIIPLSDDSLIEDFERAQLDYMKKERSILDYDPMDDYIDPKMEAALRRRKFSIIRSDTEAKELAEIVQQSEKRSWFAWLPFFGKRALKEKLEDEKTMEANVAGEIYVEDEKETSSSLKKPKDKSDKSKETAEGESNIEKQTSRTNFFRAAADLFSEFRAYVEQNPIESRKIRILRNRCVAELLLVIIYCGLGAFMFRFTEGAFETFYKCGVKRVKRDFLDTLWNFSHNMREEDWKSMARRKLMEFEEQLHTAHEAGLHSYSGQKSWSFLNAVVYCLTVITTIGYGHISPSTTTGRAITIVYAIFGIPMFLIILADFGKLFTRGIKFLWAFVRRVYYTGSCRRVRRTVPVQEVMKGVQLVYDLATFRRPSQMNPEEIQEMEKQQNQTQTVLNLDGNAPSSAQPDTPGTPALSTFAIDDEFNLPISVAIIILLAYIFVGATVYNFWEQWGFFESFYFVFISMSTIGFGDYVPKHPIYMMLSIVYLVFGLALTSMCINVVQVMLSDSFKQASQKIGATIGFEVTEEDGSIHPAAPPAVEMADVHTNIKDSESEEQIAPKAKQEDVEL